jgi:hypothetical protein
VANSEDASVWHRRSAAASNNRAWDLSVQNRTTAEDREMLDAAHASAWHWSKVGTELNRMRATMLLSEVHSLLGYGPSALAYAKKCESICSGSEHRIGKLRSSTSFTLTPHRLPAKP